MYVPSETTSKVDNTKTLAPISFAIISEVLESTVSSLKITLMSNSVAVEITSSNVLAVTTQCESFDEIIVCCVKSYSSAK